MYVDDFTVDIDRYAVLSLPLNICRLTILIVWDNRIVM